MRIPSDPGSVKEGDVGLELVRGGRVYLEILPTDPDVCAAPTHSVGMGQLPTLKLELSAPSGSKRKAEISSVKKGDTIRLYIFSEGQWIKLPDSVIESGNLLVDNQNGSVTVEAVCVSPLLGLCESPYTGGFAGNLVPLLASLGQLCGFPTMVFHGEKTPPNLDVWIDCGTVFGALKLLSFCFDINLNMDRTGGLELTPVGVWPNKSSVVLDLKDAISYSRPL